MPKKVQSRTTPNHKMQLRSWLAELVMLRSNRGRPLPPFFWRDTRWKWKYTHEVKAISKFIKQYGDNIVASVITNNRKIITARDYATMEFNLQNAVAINQRLSSPKDTTPVKYEDFSNLKDLREKKNVVRKKTLFEKLKEWENE